MDTFVIKGGKPLHGEVSVGGAKNVALKILIASLLTDAEIVIKNVPHLSDVTALIDVLSELGVRGTFEGHAVKIKNGNVTREPTVSLDAGARLRTSSMVLGPLLARYGKATVPDPGGCRIGARPIDRHIEGLRAMGADISYNSEDGFFHATAKKLHGATITFPKNTHTGTETIILAAVLAQGQTTIENAAEEVEIDDLILCLNQMGAKITRTKPRTIVIDGVKSLHGVHYTIMPDRNEEVTFAIAAAVTSGNVIVQNSQLNNLSAFLDAFTKAGGTYKKLDGQRTQYTRGDFLKQTDIITNPYPGFMTDWQAPWAVLMTQAKGTSTIHETVFESRFKYVDELRKMGATIDFFNPKIENPQIFYNFNWGDRAPESHQAIRITGPTKLHNAVMVADDIRAGATLVLAALIASGVSYIHGVERIDRGYEKIEERLRKLGAKIKRTERIVP